MKREKRKRKLSDCSETVQQWILWAPVAAIVASLATRWRWPLSTCPPVHLSTFHCCSIVHLVLRGDNENDEKA